MNRSLALLLFLVLAPSCQSRPSEIPLPAPGMAPADLVLLTGRIYTMEADRPWVEAVAVRAGRFVRVGSNDEALEIVGEQTIVIDLGGRMALPGLVDSRIRLLGGKLDEIRLELPDTDDPRRVFFAIRQYADSNGALAWILGGEYGEGVFPGDNPRKDVLDRAVRGRAAVIRARGGRALWASSKAIALAGVTEDTVAPAGGVIEKDPDTGEPSGVFRGTAMQLIESAIPPRPLEVQYEALRDGVRELNALGVTAFRTPEGGREAFRVMNLLDRAGELSARVGVSTDYRDELFVDPDQVQSPNVHPLFAEMEIWAGPADELRDRLAFLDRMGIGVTLRGPDPTPALDIVEAAPRTGGALDERHVVSLSAAPGPDALDRAARLGVVLEIAPLSGPLPGPAEGLVTTGSDWPASPDQSPWPRIAALLGGSSKSALGLAEVIRMHTMNAALAMRLEQQIGSVEVLKRADLIVLDRNLHDLVEEGRTDEVRDTRVTLTVFQGRVVHQSEADP